MSAGYSKFNWANYIDFAKTLYQEILAGEENECKIRCGISRAYYGAFHRAEAYLRRAQIDFKIYGKGSHENLIIEFEKLGKNGDKKFTKISKYLDRLKQLRVKADYYDIFFNSIAPRRDGNMRLIFNQFLIDVDEVIRTIEDVEKQEIEQGLLK